MIRYLKVVWYCRKLSNKNSHLRTTAAEALGNLGDARAVEPLIKALGDGDEDVRHAAAGALGKLGDIRAVEPLIKALGDGDGRVRREAARALGKLGDTRAVEPLIKALGGGDGRVRREAARALGKLGDARAVEPLINALLGHRYVRYEAAKALGKPGDDRAVKALINSLINGEEAFTVESVLHSLLERGASTMSPENLDSVACLENSYTQAILGECDIADYCVAGYYDVCVSEIKQMARQELIRRGLKA